MSTHPPYRRWKPITPGSARTGAPQDGHLLHRSPHRPRTITWSLRAILLRRLQGEREGTGGEAWPAAGSRYGSIPHLTLRRP